MSVARALNRPSSFWILLGVPAIPMIAGLASGRADAEGLLRPSGEFAARFMIVALMLTPLGSLFPGARWVRWLRARRRAIGVAAFGYAALHTGLYVIDMATLRNILAEVFALGIWTGWAAMAIFLPLALTSNETAFRRLGRRWTALHRWVYLAALLTLLHWIFVHDGLGPALVHFAPLAALALYRVIARLRGTDPAAARGDLPS